MKTIELKFTNEEGRIMTLSLDDPLEPVDPESIRLAMDTIIEANAIFSTGGDLVAKHSARVIERHVEEIKW